MASCDAQMVPDNRAKEVMYSVKDGYLTDPGCAPERSINLGEGSVVLTCVHETESFQERYL